MPGKWRTALWKKLVKKFKGKNGAEALQLLSGQKILTKTHLKGTKHPMADAFGESSNRSGENDDILGHHQISWVNGKDGVQPALLWGVF